jgi:hypothetical protein
VVDIAPAWAALSDFSSKTFLHFEHRTLTPGFTFSSGNLNLVLQLGHWTIIIYLQLSNIDQSQNKIKPGKIRPSAFFESPWPVPAPDQPRAGMPLIQGFTDFGDVLKSNPSG